jgi:hypothetical protein
MTNNHYKYQRRSQTPTPMILPINLLLVNYKSKAILDELQYKLKTTYFDPDKIKREQIMRLGPHLRDLFAQFVKHKEIEPIHVIRDTAVNPPSRQNINRPDVFGVFTEDVPQLEDKDYLYLPIDGTEQIALSIYFGYDHIPAILAI